MPPVAAPIRTAVATGLRRTALVFAFLLLVTLLFVWGLMSVFGIQALVNRMSAGGGMFPDPPEPPQLVLADSHGPWGGPTYSYRGARIAGRSWIT